MHFELFTINYFLNYSNNLYNHIYLFVTPVDVLYTTKMEDYQW